MINCKKAQNMISLFIDNQLSDNDREDFLKHIENCEKCRIEKEEMECIVKMCMDIGEEELPSGFKDSLRAKLQEQAAHEGHATEFSGKDADGINIDAVNIAKDKNIKGSYSKKYIRIFASIAAVMIMFVLIKGFYPQLLNPASYRMKSDSNNSLAFENYDNSLSGSTAESDKINTNNALKSAGNAKMAENRSNSGDSNTAGSGSIENQENIQDAEKMQMKTQDNSTVIEAGSASINESLDGANGSEGNYADSAICSDTEYSIAGKDERSLGNEFTTLMGTNTLDDDIDPESLYASEGSIVDQLELNIYSSDLNKEIGIIRNLISEILVEEYTDGMYNVPAAKSDSSNIAVINIMVPETRFTEFISIIDSKYSRDDLRFSPINRSNVEGILYDYEKRISEIDKRLNELEQQNGESIGEKNNLKIEKNSIIETSNKIRISTLYVFINMYIHQK